MWLTRCRPTTSRKREKRKRSVAGDYYYSYYRWGLYGQDSFMETQQRLRSIYRLSNPRYNLQGRDITNHHQMSRINHGGQWQKVAAIVWQNSHPVWKHFPKSHDVGGAIPYPSLFRAHLSVSSPTNTNMMGCSRCWWWWWWWWRWKTPLFINKSAKTTLNESGCKSYQKLHANSGVCDIFLVRG